MEQRKRLRNAGRDNIGQNRTNFEKVSVKCKRYLRSMEAASPTTWMWKVAEAPKLALTLSLSDASSYLAMLTVIQLYVPSTWPHKLLHTTAVFKPTVTLEQTDISLAEHAWSTGITWTSTVKRDVTASGRRTYRIALETPQLLWLTSLLANCNSLLFELLFVQPISTSYLNLYISRLGRGGRGTSEVLHCRFVFWRYFPLFCSTLSLMQLKCTGTMTRNTTLGVTLLLILSPLQRCLISWPGWLPLCLTEIMATWRN